MLANPCKVAIIGFILDWYDHIIRKERGDWYGEKNDTPAETESYADHCIDLCRDHICRCAFTDLAYILPQWQILGLPDGLVYLHILYLRYRTYHG